MNCFTSFKEMIMKKSVVVDAISYLLVLLFTYTGVTKLWDQHAFMVQLRQHPLLHDHVAYFVPTIPAIEVLIVFCLLIPRFRRKALVASAVLMGIFTIYVAYMVIRYPRVDLPCSCGGVMRLMSWPQHLVFNACFTVMAIIAVVMDRSNRQEFTGSKIQMV